MWACEQKQSLFLISGVAEEKSVQRLEAIWKSIANLYHFNHAF